jgi:NADH-quinone oxidoreductase subunit F
MGDPVRSLLARFPRERTWLVPALLAVQNTEGWLSPAALSATAEHVGVSPSEASTIATDYATFRLAKPGTHVVRVCSGLSCRLAGGMDHLRVLENHLGIGRGRTTSDGRLTLEETDCLSLCALAPVLDVDGACHGRVTSADAERWPRWLRPRRLSEAEVEAADVSPTHAVGRTARERLAYLRSQAEVRARARPEFRFLIQAGSCGEALGAGEMTRALRLLAAMRGLDAEVLDGACHGMCSAGIVTELQRTGWPRLTFTQLTRDAVPDLLSAVVRDRPPLTHFEGVAWNSDGWRGLRPASRHPFFAGQRRSIMERCGHLHPVSLDDALLSDGYSALAHVLDRRTPGDVSDELKASGSDDLQAAATAWEAGQTVATAPTCLVVNGEEGPAGLFTDRHLLEGDPQRVLEGLLIAAYAAGANRGIVHINGAAEPSFQRMTRALAKARAAGLIGDRILGSAFSCRVEIRRGARGFVRGEERALLDSIEGQPTSPTTKPLQHSESGQGGKAAVVTNVETLAAVPSLIAEGSDARPSQRPRSTRLLGVSGPVHRPGVVEVEQGVTLRELLFEIAGGLRDQRALKGVVVAGRSDVVLSPESLEASLESLEALSPGIRGVIAIPASDPAAEIAGDLPATR